VPSKARVRSERGAELIEFALVLPLLLFVVFGIVDFGFMFQRLEVVTNAAREGARIAVLPGYASTDVASRVRAYVQTGGVATTTSNPTISVTSTAIPTPGGPSLSAKQVRVVYTHNYLFLGAVAGWFGGAFSSVPLTGVATMRNETP